MKRLIDESNDLNDLKFLNKKIKKLEEELIFALAKRRLVMIRKLSLLNDSNGESLMEHKIEVISMALNITNKEAYDSLRSARHKLTNNMKLGSLYKWANVSSGGDTFTLTRRDVDYNTGAW